MTRICRVKHVSVIGGVIALGLAASAVALTSRGGGTTDGAPVQFARARGEIAPFKTTPEAGVRELASKLRRVSNAGLRPSDDSPGGVELHFDVAVSEFSGDDFLRGSWEGHLLAGAVRDKLAASHAPRLDGVDATLVKPNGQRRSIGGGLGHVVPGQIFELVMPALLEEVRTRAQARGFTDVHALVIPVIQDAIAVTMSIPKPVQAVSTLLKEGGVLSYLLGGRSSLYEGAYVEIRDSVGQAVYVEAAAPRAGAGMRWERPGSCLDPRDRYREPSCA